MTLSLLNIKRWCWSWRHLAAGSSGQPARLRPCTDTLQSTLTDLTYILRTVTWSAMYCSVLFWMSPLRCHRVCSNPVTTKSSTVETMSSGTEHTVTTRQSVGECFTSCSCDISGREHTGTVYCTVWPVQRTVRRSVLGRRTGSTSPAFTSLSPLRVRKVAGSACLNQIKLFNLNMITVRWAKPAR